LKNYFRIIGLFLLVFVNAMLVGQTNSPAPYCNGRISIPGSAISRDRRTVPYQFHVNDFIDCFETTGASGNISNCGSGCNGGPNNYANYCQHLLQVTPGQTISCRVQSGITYAQGFAIFVDWNQDNQFNLPGRTSCQHRWLPAGRHFHHHYVCGTTESTQWCLSDACALRLRYIRSQYYSMWNIWLRGNRRLYYLRWNGSSKCWCCVCNCFRCFTYLCRSNTEYERCQQLF
jgi:hypothetical protein